MSNNIFLKTTYKTSNLFSLKKYDHNNLNCQSYEYPTLYSIRSAILGTVIQLDGIETAKNLFYKIKNSIIYIKYPELFKKNGIKLKRYSNAFYEDESREKDLNRQALIECNFFTTMGFREFVNLDEIVFYIDQSIPNIETYLKNIDHLGTSDGLVYLDKIEKTNNLENILKEYCEENSNANDEFIYENYDWDKKIEFENAYMYSKKYKHIDKKNMYYVGKLIFG